MCSEERWPRIKAGVVLPRVCVLLQRVVQQRKSNEVAAPTGWTLQDEK